MTVINNDKILNINFIKLMIVELAITFFFKKKNNLNPDTWLAERIQNVSLYKIGSYKCITDIRQ